MSSGVGKSKYVSYLYLAISNYVKGCVKNSPGYSLQKFKNYQGLI